MRTRADNLPPFSDLPTAGQTGAHVLRSLRRPIFWVVLIGMVIAWWGVTGVTTALRKMHEAQNASQKHVKLYHPDGVYLKVVTELCGPEVQAWEKCFPRYTHKKRVHKCKRKIRALEDCAHEAQEAEKACGLSDPTLTESGKLACARGLMHKNH
ncbi:hypothetical protein Dda_4674 [Drechslerella dactyloides]|uniref:Uncharacterized protein n=1 Tax=Drechslerella dactyloides TaxID=74499 RepID=A0AAD6IXC8_DREDA|nr:hypothetical protein Dda_4674 [Drechslerella dactyloides]